jgi:hypothetical protein
LLEDLALLAGQRQDFRVFLKPLLKIDKLADDLLNPRLFEQPNL